MELTIYKNKKLAILLVWCILFAPLAGFTQGTGWQMNKSGYWIKINEGMGTSYGGVVNKDIVAANPNSVVTMRIVKNHFNILKSTDKGYSWQTLYKDTNDWTSGYDIGHPTENVTGWLMRKGYGGNPKPMFKYTTDGDKTIKSLDHQVGGGKIKGDEGINVSMYDAKNWAFTTFEERSLKHFTYIYITHDGGKTWEEEQVKIDHKKRGKYQVVLRSPKKLTLPPATTMALERAAYRRIELVKRLN